MPEQENEAKQEQENEVHQGQPQTETEPPNPGGAAPPERQCQYTKSDGRRCRHWALRGREHCFSHDRFLHAQPERPIDVPLLEDEESVIYLLSQTAQSIAWGTLPVSNGRALMTVCRIARSLHAQRLEAAKFRFKLRRHGIREEEVFQEQQADTPPPSDGDRSLDPPAPNPKPRLNSLRRFRDLKKNWDKELNRAADELGDMCLKRAKETHEEFVAARATPFEHLAAQDREIARIRAEAAAQAQAAMQAKAQSPACIPPCQ